MEAVSKQRDQARSPVRDPPRGDHPPCRPSWHRAARARGCARRAVAAALAGLLCGPDQLVSLCAQVREELGCSLTQMAQHLVEEKASFDTPSAHTLGRWEAGLRRVPMEVRARRACARPLSSRDVASPTVTTHPSTRARRCTRGSRECARESSASERTSHRPRRPTAARSTYARSTRSRRAHPPNPVPDRAEPARAPAQESMVGPEYQASVPKGPSAAKAGSRQSRADERVWSPRLAHREGVAIDAYLSKVHEALRDEQAVPSPPSRPPSRPSNRRPSSQTICYDEEVALSILHLLQYDHQASTSIEISPRSDLPLSRPRVTARPRLARDVRRVGAPRHAHTRAHAQSRHRAGENSPRPSHVASLTPRARVAERGRPLDRVAAAAARGEGAAARGRRGDGGFVRWADRARQGATPRADPCVRGLRARSRRAGPRGDQRDRAAGEEPHRGG